jgi:hypothetical protein
VSSFFHHERWMIGKEQEEETVGFIGTCSASIDLTVEIDKQGLLGVTTKRLVDLTTMVVFFGWFVSHTHNLLTRRLSFIPFRRDLTFMSGICALLRVYVWRW